VNSEVESVRKERAVTSYQASCRYLPGTTEETRENPTPPVMIADLGAGFKSEEEAEGSSTPSYEDSDGHDLIIFH
jgi:hypothetical protein